MDGSCCPATVLWRTSPNEALRANRTFTERVGIDCDELSARPLKEWIHESDRAQFLAQLERGTGSVRARHRTSAGEWLAFDWRFKQFGEETVVLGMMGLGSDWDAHTTTATRDPHKKSLRETLDEMALIVEAKNPGMRCSILLVDEDREYIVGGAGPSLPDEYNKAVEGLRIGPVVGSCGTASFWNVPVIVENIASDPLWMDLRDAAAIAGVAACWSHPVTTSSGDVLGAMALYGDEPCTPSHHQMDGLEIAARMVALAVERDRLEDQLSRAMKMEAIGVLAGGIAHDFNNLLAAVLGNAELAQTTLPEGAEAAPMLKEIVNASVNAAELCNQLLAYAGRGALTTETVECNALVKELGGLMKVALSKKANLVFALHDEPLGLIADSSQLRQVIMNLITNASEAIGDADGTIEVGTTHCDLTRAEIDARYSGVELSPGDYVRLWVRDTGSGMDAWTQAKIFDPFFTTKSTGRGLGLAAVQGIVRGHKGAIVLDSAPGAGTTFSVLLPRSPLPANSKVSAHTAEFDSRGGRILVVDDEPEVRKVISAMLARAHYTVIEAADGEQAVDLFRRESGSIDCVLLDLSMPKMDGEEVFNEMRRINARVPVVLSSGFTEQEIMDRFKGAGLAGFVQKPAQMQALLGTIAAAVGDAAIAAAGSNGASPA